jgi:hypothetical protein
MVRNVWHWRRISPYFGDCSNKNGNNADSAMRYVLHIIGATTKAGALNDGDVSLHTPPTLFCPIAHRPTYNPVPYQTCT